MLPLSLVISIRWQTELMRGLSKGARMRREQNSRRKRWLPDYAFSRAGKFGIFMCARVLRVSMRANYCVIEIYFSKEAVC